MDQATGAGGPAMSAAEEAREQSPEQLRCDIEETREQLGDTVEALAEKTDVKAQTRQRVRVLQASARQKRDQARAKAKAAAPESASAGAQRVAVTARNNRLPVAVTGALVLGFFLGRSKSN